MRFEYLDQTAKYDTLRHQIEAAGYSAIISSQAGDAILLAQPGRSGYFVVGKRNYCGWFVCLFGPTYYLIPDAEHVAPLCLRLLQQPYKDEVHWPRIDTNLETKFHLVSVNGETWSAMEYDDNRQRWLKCGWRELSDSQTIAAWERFDTWSREILPSLPVRTFDISWLYTLPEDEFERIEGLITIKALDALRHITSVYEELIVLQRNYNAYLFAPHSHNRKLLRDYWVMPILPDGDSYQFVAQDFRLALLSNWNAKTIHTFGLPPLEIPACVC